MGTIKLALRPWKSLPIVQWMGVFSLAILIIGMNAVYWLDGSVDQILKKLSAEKVVTVYLEPSATIELVDTIKTQIGSSSVDTRLVDQKGFLEELEKSHPQLAKEVQALGADADWVAPRFMTLRGDMTNEAVEKIKALSGVEAVDLSEQRLKPVTQSLRTIQSVSRGFLVGLVIAFLTTLFLIARLNRHVQSDSIRLIRQFGGTAMQAKMPQILHQTFLGTLSGIFASCIWLYAQPIMVYHLGSLSPYFKDLKLQNPLFVLSWIFLATAIGWISALFASSQAAAENA
jgi:cell division protein FtsX